MINRLAESEDEATGRVKIREDANGGHRFRIYGMNGELVAMSENYVGGPAAALRGLQDLRNALELPLIDATGTDR